MELRGAHKPDEKLQFATRMSKLPAVNNNKDNYRHSTVYLI